MRSLLVVALLLTVCVASSGCWEDWQRFFDTTPSTEHRIQDLRVLAFEFTPTASRPEALRVDLVDPRGGAARVELRACLRPTEFVPCVDKGVVVGSVDVEFDDEFGEGRADFVFGDADLAALAAAAGIEVDASPVFVDVIADVVTLQQQPAEREVASVTVSLYNELRIADAAVDRFRTCINPEDPEQNPACFGAAIGEGEDSVCGDNVVEGLEGCEPPGIAGCNEFCQTIGTEECPQPEPACLVSTPQNLPPRIVSLRVDDAIRDEFEVPIADREDIIIDVDVAAGGSVRIQPVVNRGGAYDVYQPWSLPFAFDLEQCGAALTAGCPIEEVPAVRFYVEDGDVDIATSALEEDFGVNNRGLSVAEVVVGKNASGDQPLWIVVVDGRGGMGFHRVTLHVR